MKLLVRERKKTGAELVGKKTLLKAKIRYTVKRKQERERLMQIEKGFRT